jgi:hypothetical protein
MNNTVRQCRFAVIDMGNDGKIANMLHQNMKYKIGFQLRAKTGAAKLEIKILY